MLGKGSWSFVALVITAALLSGTTATGQQPSGTGDGIWPAIRINFQLEGAKTPCGYVADTGKVFGPRKGLVYGWNTSHEDVTRDRGVVSNQLKDTLSHFHQGGKWEIEVANGWHHVHIGIGDASYESTYFLNVEGVPMWKDVYLPPKDFRHARIDVLVSDGKLTLDQGRAWDKATRIDYIEIDAGTAKPSGCSGGDGGSDGGGNDGGAGDTPQPEPGTIGGTGDVGARPYGLKGLKKTFGKRCNSKANDARTYFPSASGRGKSGYVYYHSKLAKRFGGRVLGALKRKNRTGAVDYGVWGYACRLKTGGTSWSVHSWGVAIDTNTLRNPYGAHKWNGKGANGKKYGRFYPNALLSQGFYWGINFRDPMHFQYVSGY